MLRKKKDEEAFVFSLDKMKTYGNIPWDNAIGCLVAAIGRPEFVTADMVKPGAVVVDVGMNKVKKEVVDENGEKKLVDKLVGDVDFDSVKEVAGWITPVPGGVGPLTVTMLLHNALTGAKRQTAK